MQECVLHTVTRCQLSSLFYDVSDREHPSMKVVYLGRKCDMNEEAHDEKLLSMWQFGNV